MTEIVKNGTPHDTKGDVFTSYNVDDFDVPGGRDEIWRFISLRALRGLHNGKFPEQTAPDIEVTVADGQQGVEVGTRPRTTSAPCAPAPRPTVWPRRPGPRWTS